ncbi:MAG TPA: glycine--tRNA ligase subunit beta [Rhodanobacteraceae bacterium]|nr:glycine--tRNA ligase subunit beta [Rhodanobacteraceae bacterium]
MTINHQSLLIELGTEELPPKALDTLAAAFAHGVCDGLQKRGIAADTANARTFCTPRRLAVYVPGVAKAQPDQSIERRGPAVQAGRDAEGKPSRALTGFAASCGVDVDALETMETDKGAWYVYRAVQTGQATADLLPEILVEALKGLPIPRPMRWGDHDYSFVRPVHWLVMLHGDQVVDAELMGLVSGRASRGHRFHHPEPVDIADADSWLDSLRKARVLADPAERRQRIRDEIARVTKTGKPRLSDDLLDELANLTEWPAAIACAFERDFLRVPAEALITTMESNQKFVPVFADDGQLSEHFIGIANIESKDPAEIRKGYERVIRPRFADAQFFYTEDLKTPLADLQKELANVTYQKALGSLWDKTCRVAELARVIANRVGVDAGEATRAASLAKCDLLTRMVGEFPELQGVMGRYYAAAQGESEAVAQALDEFYMPRQSGDRIAEGQLSRVLAVAERLDTLAGIFAVGMKPSGNKDPFVLRRAAQGLARTLIEGDLAIDLDAAFREALELIPETALLPSPHERKAKGEPALLPSPSGRGAGGEGAPEAKRRGPPEPSPAPPGHPLPTGEGKDAGARRARLRAELNAFVLERLRSYYADQGFSHGQFEAVAAVHPRTLPDFDRRLRAVAEFAKRPEAESLAAANKRVGNILRKQAEAGAEVASRVDEKLFEDEAESALAQALSEASGDSRKAVEAGDYTAALTHLSALQAPVDHFFDKVLVMADDIAVRSNRLALLAALQNQFMAIADIGCL